jgi:hypothetical protein
MANDIAVRKSTDVAQLDELERILLGESELPEVVDDPAEISREIMAQLLAAESDEELEAVGSAVGWRELVGVPMELHGFRWRPSSFEEGAPVFFVVNANRLDTGERVVLTTGSGNILAQLCNMARRGTLVGAIRALEIADTPTKQGFRPNWLRTPTGTMIEASKEAADRGEAPQPQPQEAKA